MKLGSIEKDKQPSVELLRLFEKTRVAYLSANEDPDEYGGRWRKTVDMIKDSYEELDAAGKELKNFIEEKDPNAVFVVTSDHGPGIDLDGDETSFNYEEKLLATTIFFSSNLNKFCDINLDSSYYLQNFFIDFFNCFGNMQLENLEEKIIFYDYITNKFEKISS